MPTAKAFAAVPPFPSDIPVFELPKLSYKKLSSNDAAESLTLFNTFRSHGFALLDLRGCPDGELLLQEAERMFEITEDVTIGLPLEEKMKYVPTPPCIFGYSTVGKTKIESGEPDRFESFSINQDEIFGNVPHQVQPAPVEDNRDEIKSYIKHAYEAGMVLLRHLDKHLRLPEGTFESLQRLDKESGSTLRMLRYPPQPEGDRRTAFLGHTDIGTITILFNVLGGLQILPPGKEAKEENWMYIRPEPGCAIVNLGDAMVEWSGGVLRSNLHRVYFAPGAQAEYERYSLAYAIRPEGVQSMKRLDVEGSLIPDLGEKEEDLDCDANQWLARKGAAIRAGKDNARSRGGAELKVVEIRV